MAQSTEESLANLVEGLSIQTQTQPVEKAPLRTSLFPYPDELTPGENPKILECSKFITRILIDEKREILSVGESDTISMSIALALRRGGFEGIWASHERVPPNPQAIEKVEQIVGESDAAKLTLTRLSLKVDANNMEIEDPKCPASIVWFNFPWIRGRTGRVNIAGMLVKFFESTKTLQKDSGGVILLGLVSPCPEASDDWSKYYELDALVSKATELGYTGYYTDSTFIQECAAERWGYKHGSMGERDSIHSRIIPASKLHAFVHPGTRSLGDEGQDLGTQETRKEVD